MLMLLADDVGEDQFCSARHGIVGSYIFNISQLMSKTFNTFKYILLVYLMEISLRLLLDGPVQYLKKWWNW